MELDRSTLIVGCYNRGMLIARALVEKQIPVQYLDVTPNMGPWPSEDQEGPFGLFRTEGLTTMDYEVILSGDLYQEIENGFTFLLPSGPLELKGPLTQYQLGSVGWSLGSISKNKPWLSSWLGYFERDFNSCILEEAPCSQGIQLDHTFYHRWPTRLGFDKTRNALADLGVQFLSETRLMDVAPQPEVGVYVELMGRVQGKHQYRNLIWFLTSEETEFYSKSLSEKLFDSKVQRPSWSWMRYRIRLTGSPELSELPSYFVILNDLLAPWHQENMMVMHSTSSTGVYDVWLRLSNVQRFHKDYLSYFGRRIEEVISSRLSCESFEILNFPQEYYYSQSEMGPVCHGVYQKRSISNSKRDKWKRSVFFDGPEFWSHYTYREQKKSATELISRLMPETSKQEKE